METQFGPVTWETRCANLDQEGTINSESEKRGESGVVLFVVIFTVLAFGTLTQVQNNSRKHQETK